MATHGSHGQRPADAPAPEVARLVFRDSPIAVVVTDLGHDGRILDLNPAACRLLGRRRDELLGHTIVELTHPEDRALTDSGRRGLVSGELERVEYEKRFVRGDGSEIWTHVIVSLAHDDAGEPVYTIGHIADITARRRMEAELMHERLHDRLTGLPNRDLLLDRIGVALAAREARVAVISLDVDRFNLVNEDLGYEVGDEVVRALAVRLRDVLRPADTVARAGGNQFAVVAEGVGAKRAAAIAERLLNAVSTPLTVAGVELRLGASAGIGMGARDGDPEVVLREAEAAMHEAKTRGGRRYEFFEVAIGMAAGPRLALERELRRAIENGEIVPYYQPKMRLRESGFGSVEALARWIHPERGVVMPADFIPLAEAGDLIVPLGTEILTTVCRDARRMRGAPDPLIVCVNFSARQLGQPDVTELVERVLDETGLEPGRLCIEVTETAIMQREEAAPVLHRLKRLGVRIAIDDFGTGMSSLERVRTFPPIDFLKIDRSFIAGVDSDPRDAAIVEAVVRLGHALGCSVVAEGVERQSQAETVRRLGCDAAQGYLYGMPAPLEELMPASRS